MVDIFAVTILVALVHLGAIANIEAQKGVVFFAAVVVITMFAAMSFDPRLIWDTKESEDACEYALEPDAPEFSEPVVQARKHQLSLVWLVPVIAALIGGWLIYKTLV